MFQKDQVPPRLVAEKNLYDGVGKQQRMIVQSGTKGKVIDGWEWGPHKYIMVEFSNGVKLEFADSRHPLISWKGFIRFTG